MVAREIVRAATLAFVVGTTIAPATAGPPFVTDDPEPTSFRHWEIYSGATYDNDGTGDVDASLPFVEINYGALPNVQISASVPLVESAAPGGPRRYGNGGLEFGIKTRFVQESAKRPQISFYPSIETPSPGSGDHVVTFLPVWLQKSWGRWTAFGGGGLYLNPGVGKRNSAFTGGALERALSAGTTVGVEVFHQSSEALATPGSTGANVGAIVQIGSDHAALLSLGRGSSGRALSSYASYEFQLGPHAEAGVNAR